jgi:uncharacterized coiled-coil protein SlyX
LTVRDHRTIIPAMMAPAVMTQRAERKDRFQRIAPGPSESLFALAERAVADLEARCRRQEQILADLEKHHVPSAVVAAREMLETLKCSLRQVQRALQQLHEQDQRHGPLR